MMLLIILIAIFFRPFICSLAFPYLNFIYSALLLVFLAVYMLCSRPLPVVKPVLKYPLVLFCLSLFISVIWTGNRSISLGELYKYISGIALLLFAATLSGENKSKTIHVIVSASLVISALAVYQYYFSFHHVADYLVENRIAFPFALDYLQRKRVFLPFVTPGVLGGYLAMVIPLACTYKKWVWPTLLIFTALVLTMSPVALLSLFCGLMVYFCLQGRLKKSNVIVLAGLLFLIIAMTIWRSGAGQEYIRPLFSMNMRLNYWQQSWMLLRKNFIVGMGLGNFNLQASRYAHNSYLQILTETGILGLSAVIWLVSAAFRSGVINLKQSMDRKQACGLIAASVVFLVHNLLDFTFFLPEISLIWWLILGMAMVPAKEP